MVNIKRTTQSLSSEDLVFKDEKKESKKKRFLLIKRIKCPFVGLLSIRNEFFEEGVKIFYRILGTPKLW